MVLTSNHQSQPSKELINFLRQKMNLSENALNLGIKQAQIEQAPLSIILWSYGLLNLSQYQEVLDWQKSHEY